MTTPTPANRRRTLAAIVLALGFHLLGACLVAVYAHFPTSLDEVQHLSYIRWLEAHPAVFPRYEAMPVLDATARHWTGVGNYLNHPAPYYALMGVADRALGGSVLGLRLVDVGLSTLALALMMAAASCALRGWAERTVFCFTLVLFPKLGVISGIINNDNAALFTTAAVFAGLIVWQRRPHATQALALAIGLALAGWTKFTVFLMAIFATAIAEVLRWGRREPRPALGRYGLILLGGALGAITSLVNLARYHRPLYHSNFFYVAPAARVRLDFPGYALLFFRQLADKWAAGEPASPIALLSLALVLLLAAMACVAGWRAIRRGDALAPAWRAALGLMLALVPTLVLHLEFGWRAVVEDGFLYMAQARYYYGLWPGFALGLALLWRESRPGPLRAVVTVATGAALAWSSAAVLMLTILAQGKAAPV